MESKKRNMTESMKFGPEWLRNLSGDNCSNSSGAGGLSLTAPRYQLAEHRYGREEMLALFDHGYKAPEMLTSFSTLYIEKTQLPLALIQMTEDETRMWNGGITSTSSRGGRGGSVDRGGRGRGGRGGLYTSHPRGIGFDETGDGGRLEAQSFSTRGRPFDRSQSERGWSERNGASDSGDWNGSTSPRKELSRGASGGSLMENNWRRQRGNSEDDDGWRAGSNTRGEKWGKASWREAGGSDRDRAEGDGEGESRSGGRWEHRGNHRSNYDSSHHPPHRTARTWESNHHDNHDNLPEWVTENPSESGGGSFDALGAFHGGGIYLDDEDEEAENNTQEPRTRRISEGSSTVKSSNHKSSSLSNSNNNSTNNNVHHASNRQHSSTSKDKPKLKTTEVNEEKDDITDQEKRQSPTKPLPPTAKSPPRSLKKLESKSQKIAHVTENADKRDDSSTLKPIPDEICKTESMKEAKISTNHHHQQQQVSKCNDTEELKGNNAIKQLLQQKPKSDLDRMKEEADALVAKLMADESGHKEVPSVASQPPSGIEASVSVQEKWFYRDPQGEVQGPFLASEMAEWWKQGYFSAGLMIRRSCDERYTTLGDLMTTYGRVPFEPGPPIPPLTLNEPVLPPVSNAVPAGITSNSPMSKPAIDDPLLLLQYQQLRLLQNQQMLLRQMRTAAIAKLSQSEHWSTLSPVEQNQLILQYVSSQEAEVPEIPPAAMPPNAFVASSLATPPPPNPVMQLINQMQQAKTQADSHVPSNNHPTGTAVHPGPIDPIQQLMSSAAAGISNLPTMPQANINIAPQDDNPIKMLLRQLNANGHHPQPIPVDSVWPQPPPPPPPHIAAQFTTQNWLPQVGSMPTLPPRQMPPSLWDIHCTDIEREQQKQQQQQQKLVEKQNNEAQESKRNKELKKQEELKKKAEEEYARKKRDEEQARQTEENKKKKEDDKKRKEEERRKHEEEQKKKEEKKRKEEERKREEKRKQDEELNRKKQEEERKKKEELRKQEERQKKEEEKRKKMEEELAKIEAERIRKEEEARKKAELEEQNRRTEQRRREAEALRKLQERSKAPWAQTPHAPAATTHASLAEIQRLEREKKAEEQRLQQLLQHQQQQQLAQQKAAELAQDVATMDSSKRLQFKWAEMTNVTDRLVQVKSLAQIQQEEQERVAKVKQQEKEKQEKAGQKDNAMALQNTGIWGTASQTLNWANASGSSSQAWGNAGNSGFWDDATLAKSNASTKAPGKQTSPSSKVLPTASQQQQQQQVNSKASKSKNKKEEELVKKLFEQNTAKTDDFTQWCNKALSGLQVSVDIPTFIGFLRDIESPYEVKEYVRMYLGDGKQCTEFAKQFLEKRSKWRSAQRPQIQADDLCKPAPAVNPNACTEFQEVKGKSKKPKKGKMFKVDNRILGFSVTSAPDRINVGDRDYGEGM